MFVRIKGERDYLWRAIDPEGEGLESFVTKTRDKTAALRFLKKAMRKTVGQTFSDRQLTGRWPNTRAENTHCPF
jgi:putative transposase